jgi:hypothetical protein
MGHHCRHSSRFPQSHHTEAMSTLTIQIPDSLARQLHACAEDEGVTVDQLLASAAAEKLSALMTVDHLRQRAARAKREDFIAFLDAAPDLPPVEGDGLS